MLSFPHILFYPKIYYDKIVTLLNKFLPPNHGARIWPRRSPPEFIVNYNTIQIDPTPGRTSIFLISLLDHTGLNWNIYNSIKLRNTQILAIKLCGNVDIGGPLEKSKIEISGLSPTLYGMWKYLKGGSRGIMMYENNVRNFISWKNHYDFFPLAAIWRSPIFAPWNLSLDSRGRI